MSEKQQRSGRKAGEVVESPMVGVIYLQPHPDEDPYVKVGDRVEQGDVICIVEAMKLMNEIQAPHSGVITEILVEMKMWLSINNRLFELISVLQGGQNVRTK